jgi:alkanesulfonate monooxygenase SsuD/methylene tetrahydromethanopterin reductase-like flavin-dependent oxidoreductase (luciferase family)
MGAEGKPAAAGLIPGLEESIDQRIWLVGTADDVGEQIEWYRDLLGVENLMLFPMMPGDSYTAVEDQLGRLATDVLPRFT